MPYYSTRSATRLAECHADLRALFDEVIKHRDCSILCGARSQADQDQAVAERRSKAVWPTSNHNVDGVRRVTSWACDVSPYPIDWENLERFAGFAEFVLETAAAMLADGRMTYAVRWGGDWDGDGDWRDERFLDMPHYELVGVESGT